MLETINRQIAEYRLDIRHKANWERRQEELQSELAAAAAKCHELKQQLGKEQADVDRLERLSLGALFYALIGQKESRLSKEQEELLQAKLNYEEAAATVEDVERELLDVKLKLGGMRRLEDEIGALLVRKQELIRSQSDARADKLNELSDWAAELGADVRELEEACSAGRGVIRLLDHALKLLGSALNWGTWDMLGGGTISTAMKHSRIDEARSALHAAQRGVERFRRELQDVQRDTRIQVEIGGLITLPTISLTALSWTGWCKAESTAHGSRYPGSGKLFASWFWNWSPRRSVSHRSSRTPRVKFACSWSRRKREERRVPPLFCSAIRARLRNLVWDTG